MSLFASLRPARRRLPSGFTLIEMLVVIAVIAVLAAILFPVFAKARAGARKTTGISNLKQIATALQMYSTDYDEHLPNRWPIWLGYRPFFWRVEGGDLPAHLRPYVKNAEVWHSPEDRLWNKAATSEAPTSFSVNAELAPGWPLAQIPRPAEAIYLTDRTDLDALTIGPSKESPDVYFWWAFCDPPLETGPADLPRQYDDLMVAVQISPRRYVGDVAAYLFLDSHVKALPFGQTWGDRTTNLHYAFK